MEKGINTEKDFEIAKKIAHVLSGDCSEENRSSLDEWLSESEGNRNLYERIPLDFFPDSMRIFYHFLSRIPHRFEIKGIFLSDDFAYHSGIFQKCSPRPFQAADSNTRIHTETPDRV